MQPKSEMNDGKMQQAVYESGIRRALLTKFADQARRWSVTFFVVDSERDRGVYPTRKEALAEISEWLAKDAANR